MEVIASLLQDILSLLKQGLTRLLQRQKYNIVFSVVSTPGTIEGDFAEVTFVNTGTNNLVINGGLVLVPNEQLIINGNQNEVDVTNYYLNFIGAGQNSCTVIRKEYTA